MRRLLLALVLAFVSVLTGNQARASTSVVLVASSGHEGVAVFTLAAPLTLTAGWSFSGAGAYRVAALLSVHPTGNGDRYPTVVWDNRITYRGGLGSAFPLRLPAGSYYLYLSSDKPVSVTLPSSTRGTVRQLKTRPVNLQSVLMQGMGAPSTPPSSDEQHEHAFVQHASATFLQVQAHISAPVGWGQDTVGACVLPRDGSSCSGGFESTAADESTHDFDWGGSQLYLSAYSGFTGAARAVAHYQTLGTHHIDRWTFLSMSFPV